LDLYYKYEFQALKLKRARDVLTNRKYWETIQLIFF
jgi:hypothetical protein